MSVPKKQTQQVEYRTHFQPYPQSCILQDDAQELTRGVNTLGLYVASADAFVTIEHEVKYTPYVHTTIHYCYVNFNWAKF